MLFQPFIPQILIDSLSNVGHIIRFLGYIVGPPYPRVLHPQIQPNSNQKYSEKDFRKFPEAKLELVTCQQLFI